MAIYTFKRWELKYRLSRKQYYNILPFIKNYLSLDKYGLTTIQSLYFDTENDLLIRRSIEKPYYKEKIRLRSYGLSNNEKLPFLEIKKKFEKVVYKRRIKIKEDDCLNWIQTKQFNATSQIEKELQYFINFYKTLKPRMLLIYDREAYTTSESDLRITFDSNMRYRDYDLRLDKGFYGKPLLEDDTIIMEIKSSTAFPLWLVKKLSEEKIYKSSFSKYGTAYKNTKQKESINV